MTGNVLRDAELVPALGDVLRAGVGRYEVAVREILLAGRGLRGRRRSRAKAAIGLAISFGAWQHLVRRDGLSDADAVEVMCAMVEAV